MSATPLPNHTELAPDFYGRKLGLYFRDGYAAAARALRPGEALYVLHDQIIKKVPVLVESQAEFDDNKQRHNMGLSVSYDIVAGPAPVRGVVIIQEDDSDEIEIRSFRI